MNKREQEEVDTYKTRHLGKKESYQALDLLSDGEQFCECQEPEFGRPGSRGLFSDEEFQDAETENKGDSRNISGFNDVFYAPICSKVERNDCKEGLWAKEYATTDLWGEEDQEKKSSSHRLFQEWKNIDVIHDGDDATQAAKRFKTEGSRSSVGLRLSPTDQNNPCPIGKGDGQIPHRNRSLSRIPVASGRCSISQTKIEPEMSDTKKELESLQNVTNTESPSVLKEQVFDILVQPETRPSMENVNKNGEMERCSRDDTCESSDGKKCGDSSNHGEISEVGFKIMNDLCAPSKAILDVGPAPAEFVVMTLAEERPPKPQDLLLEGRRSRLTSRDGRTGLGTRNKEPNTGLDTLIRERSRSSLMKQEEAVETRNQRSTGRQSATSPGRRLQAIREEKAQIRQRISSAKPMSPARGRRFVATPNIKPTLTSPLANNSLKREIASRRSAIERLGKEPVKRSTGQNSTECRKESEGTKRSEGQSSKVGQTVLSRERSKLLERVANLARIPACGGGGSNKNDSKPVLSTLTSRYSARSRAKEDHKAELNKSQLINSWKKAEKPTLPLALQRSSTAGVPEDAAEDSKVDMTPRPMSAQLPASSHDMQLSDSSTSVVGTNTEPVEDKSEVLLSLLQKEKGELHQTTEELKKELDFLKRNSKERDDREVELIKERNSLQKNLKEEEKRVKDLEYKLADRDTTLAQLRGNLAKLQDLSEKIKTKDSQLVSLRRQFAEESKEHNMQLKKALDAKENLHQELQKERNNYQRQVNKMQEDNGSLQIQLEEALKKAALLEQKQTELDTKLQKESQRNHNLEDNLMSRESELFALEKKLEEMENSSRNILGLSEQLMQKDTIISELEKHRANVQAQNTEMCGVLSSAFSLLGQDVAEKEVEALLSSGRALLVTDMLRQLIQERNESLDNKKKECEKESEKKYSNLEDQVALLQSELQMAKNYSETLAGVISETKPWRTLDQINSKDVTEGDTPPGVYPGQLIKGINKRPACVQRSPSASLALSNNGHQGNMRELFLLLEGKKQALQRMEKKMQELEEIHANCAQKRVRNEIRIDQLEMMLASYKD